jgi:hypothetical protein
MQNNKSGIVKMVAQPIRCYENPVVIPFGQAVGRQTNDQYHCPKKLIAHASHYSLRQAVYRV